MSRPRDLFQKLSLAVVSTGAALGLAELILRLFFPIAYSMELEHLPDGHLGARLTPDRTYTLASGGTCTVNNLGFRGRDPVSYQKTPGSVRIVVLGGSSTFCYQTDDDAVWTAVLGRELNGRYGQGIEVVNAGVPGYSVFESKVNYLYQIRPLGPDVVLVYHTWNDMKFFQAIERGIYPKKGVPRGNASKSFLRQFQLAWRVRNAYHEIVLPRQRENAIRAGGGRVTIARDGSAHRWEKQSYDDLAVLLAKDGVVPVFASQAGLLSEDNVADPAVRAVVYAEYQNMSFEEILGEWHEISRLIEEVSVARGLLFIDVYDQVPHTRKFFRDHVHLTDAGNERVAQAFFEGLSGDPVLDRLFRNRQPLQNLR